MKSTSSVTCAMVLLIGSSLAATSSTLAQSLPEHVEEAPGRGYFPASGYVWSHLDAKGQLKDYEVEWKPDLPHMRYGKEDWPHLISSQEQGWWSVEPGYTWSRKDASGHPLKNELGVEWKAGSAYRRHDEVRWKHVRSVEEEGFWKPDPGYTWTDKGNELNRRWGQYLDEIQSDGEWNQWQTAPHDAWRTANRRGPWWISDTDLDVAWTPKTAHDRSDEHVWANVVASTDEGKFLPAPGYAWSEEVGSGGLTKVQWDPGRPHKLAHETQWPHVVAGKTEGTWEPAWGYDWVRVNEHGLPITLAVQPRWYTRVMNLALEHWIIAGLILVGGWFLLNVAEDFESYLRRKLR